MYYPELLGLPIDELLVRSQTNVTPDPLDGYVYAEMAYFRGNTAIEKGMAARQAGFRAEQAELSSDAADAWFEKSRLELFSHVPPIRRERIATELLYGRTLALRIELGKKSIGAATEASEAFALGEEILQEQHEPRKPWDRFGTMLSRHRATHEAMNGSAGLAATTALRGIWRAARAKREGTPESHRSFVAKQIGMNTAAGALAASKPFSRFEKVAALRHRFALKLLG